jgi:hypothetical protein
MIVTKPGDGRAKHATIGTPGTGTQTVTWPCQDWIIK